MGGARAGTRSRADHQGPATLRPRVAAGHPPIMARGDAPAPVDRRSVAETIAARHFPAHAVGVRTIFRLTKSLIGADSN